MADIPEAAARGVLKKGVLENFTKFTGKTLCLSLFFNKVTDLIPTTLLKRRIWHRCFPVSFAKFSRALFLQNSSGWLLLTYARIMKKAGKAAYGNYMMRWIIFCLPLAFSLVGVNHFGFLWVVTNATEKSDNG